MIIEKGVIDYDVKEGKEIIAKDNEIIDLNTSKALLFFEHQVVNGIQIINKDTFFGSDFWGNKKLLKYSKVFEVPYIPKCVLTEDLCIVRFKESKTTAKIDLDENILWEQPFYPVLGGIIPGADLIVFLEGAGTPKKRLHFSKISTGEILSSLDCGEIVPRILGANSKNVWIASKNQKYIKSIDLKTGQIVDEVQADSIVSMSTLFIDLEYFKYDFKNNKLIQPYGELDLKSKRFEVRNYFSSFDFGRSVYVPSVFPFVLDGKYLAFGLQMDNLKTNETETRLIVMQRNLDEVPLDVPINSNKPGAGLLKITLIGERLIYLDSFNNLHEMQLSQLL